MGFAPCVQEYLNFRGGKFSERRGATVDLPYFLSKYDPDALRSYLTPTAPKTRDTEFSWEDFVEIFYHLTPVLNDARISSNGAPLIRVD